MLAADPVHMGSHPDGESRHVETLSLRFWSISQTEKVFAREPQLFPIARKVPVHEMMGKDVVTGRHRRVGCKNCALTDHFAGICVRRSVLDQFANALQGEEGGVAFVGMPDRR